jgi:hypothetical protein
MAQIQWTPSSGSDETINLTIVATDDGKPAGKTTKTLQIVATLGEKAVLHGCALAQATVTFESEGYIDLVHDSHIMRG